MAGGAGRAVQRGVTRILAIADEVAPFVYSENFPGNLGTIDLIVSAGDIPGYLLEFLATKHHVPPVYVLGNHANGYVRDAEGDERHLPGGCINAHRRVVTVAGVTIAGIEGSLRYRPGEHQYSAATMERFALGLAPRLGFQQFVRRRPLDLLLTHAAPCGPHEGEDRPHRGVRAFNRLHRWWRPKLHVHGHVHLNGANAPRTYVSPEGVRVVNAFGFTLIDL